MKKKKKKQKKIRLKPISLSPLKPEEALSAFMKVDINKIKESEEKNE